MSCDIITFAIPLVNRRCRGWPPGDQDWCRLVRLDSLRFSSIRSYSVVFGRIRSYSVVFGRIRSYSVVFGRIRSYSVVFGRIRSYSVVFGRIRSYSVVFCHVLATFGRIQSQSDTSSCIPSPSPVVNSAAARQVNETSTSTSLVFAPVPSVVSCAVARQVNETSTSLGSSGELLSRRCVALLKSALRPDVWPAADLKLAGLDKTLMTVESQQPNFANVCTALELLNFLLPILVGGGRSRRDGGVRGWGGGWGMMAGEWMFFVNNFLWKNFRTKFGANFFVINFVTNFFLEIRDTRHKFFVINFFNFHTKPWKPLTILLTRALYLWLWQPFHWR